LTTGVCIEKVKGKQGTSSKTKRADADADANAAAADVVAASNSLQLKNISSKGLI